MTLKNPTTTILVYLASLRNHTSTVKGLFKQLLITWGQVEGAPDDLPLISTFIMTTDWENYTPGSHCQKLLQSLPPSTTMPTINKWHWKTFWSHPQRFHARTLWHRLLTGK
ncbi:hypothetical protein BCR42DRAFT_474133 [Absidia repens]|uniref:Uncharacterized protein n=1 Tax=Absidia repens TaxID=90262 RepID=A0A1X2HY50_9FUNG|nr:hypothetical protein BCR42DRAFT_474133 [Absidia repens]